MAGDYRVPKNLMGGGKERTAAVGERWVLLCGPEDFCAEARREMLRRRRDLQAATADGIESARQILKGGETPAVILAEERVLADGAVTPRQRGQTIAAALSLLAGFAPVVWIGGAQDAGEIWRAVQDAPVDFVPRSALCVSAAVAMAERRLHTSEASLGAGRAAGSSFGEQASAKRDFGEVLRHELNNPLTGIMGNAELLLLEVRRGRLELPAHNLRRLETIADLAVRMRETVRILSEHWEGAGGDLSRENEPPHWPAGG